MATRTRWILGVAAAAAAIAAVTYGAWRLETGLRGGDVARVEQPLSSVPERRLRNMARGINLPFWLTGDGRGQLGRQDLRLLTRLGITHIRLPFSPERLLFHTGWNPDGASAPELFQEIDEALDLLLGAGFSVSLDMHPRAPFKRVLEDDNTFVERVMALWRAIGAHVATRDPDYLFLEIMNEPDESFSAQRWLAVQRRLAKAIRSVAPRHTIIATGPRWGRVDALTKMPLLDDPNVVYAFHFYEPLTFTHQGITWGNGDLRHIAGLTYPSDSGDALRLVRRISHAGARRRVRTYAEQGWSAQKIDEIIASARAWSDSRGVPIICNEFGVYVGAVRASEGALDVDEMPVPRPARAAWLRDVRTSLERHGIPWAHWDYATDFGIVRKRMVKGSSLVPTPVLDMQVIWALGLDG